MGPEKSVRLKVPDKTEIKTGRWWIKLAVVNWWSLFTAGHYSQLVVKQVILFLFSCKIKDVSVWHIEFLNFFYKNENLSWIRLELCTYQSVKFGKIWNLKRHLLFISYSAEKLLKSDKNSERSDPLFWPILKLFSFK